MILYKSGNKFEHMESMNKIIGNKSKSYHYDILSTGESIGKLDWKINLNLFICSDTVK